MSYGKLITVEGIDGAGKTTAIATMMKSLSPRQKQNTISLIEPTHVGYGLTVRNTSGGRLSVVNETMAFLLDRSQHLDDVILPALKNGVNVVIDRYYHSTIAYQGASGCNVKMLKKLCTKLFHTPDITYLLDISPETAMRRIVERGVKTQYENTEYLSKVHWIYDRLCEEDTRIIKIDATKESIELPAP